MDNNYFTVKEYDSLVFFQMPKMLIYADEYRKMSGDAKILYTVCVDLIKLSMTNHGKKDKFGNRQMWKDENGFYIKLSVEKIQQVINCAKPKAIKLKGELEKYNLLKQKRMGVQKANLLYVLQLNYTEDDIFKVNDEHDELQEIKIKNDRKEPKSLGTTLKSQNVTSRSNKILLQEVTKSYPINNKDINNKNINNKKLNLNHSENDILTILWNLDLPMNLKQRIKVKIASNNIHLLSNQLLDIEDAYKYQIKKLNIVPDCNFDETLYLNDEEFSNTVIKMLESVKDIENMKGLIQSWVSTALDHKFKVYN